MTQEKETKLMRRIEALEASRKADSERDRATYKRLMEIVADRVQTKHEAAQ